ncbi:outer membrane lipoprotein-sorting protein [Desulfogranum japonicum]|uniref:outer membrane lipoprotein-sorting protein n=1 Tax=Desulfogranum japonicum TaxID=231447 RepID=UPI0004237586|nr:outer membrane lipoprotein-sorting protein [Desulfogranum japonicum]
MKHSMNTMHSLFPAITLSLIFLVPSTGTLAGTPDARQIMEQVDARDDGDRSISDIQMILIDRNGAQRTRTLISYGLDKGEDKYRMMMFLSPADVKETGFLTYDYDAPGKDDDQWLYLPALRKVKRIATGDKTGSFVGSDFSYADLTDRRLSDYDYSFHPKQSEIEVYGKKCWVIDSVPVSQDVIDETGYTKSISFVRQDNFVVIRSINYLEDGGKTKYYDVKELEQIDGIWTEKEIHMTTKKGKSVLHQTILSMRNIRFNQESVNDELFTTRRLEKGL